MRNIIITVDRIEGKYAVCIGDDGTNADIPLSFFDSSVSENDVYNISFEALPDLKQSRYDENKSLFDRLRKKGDIH